MTFARVRLLLAAALFFGWMAWLGTAVLQRGSVLLVSRAQVTGATHLVVAAVTAGNDGLPMTKTKVIETLRGDVTVGEIDVTNLHAAQPPGASGFPGAGEYLLPLTANADGKTFVVAGLPRSPGYEPAMPQRPVIYPWTDDVKKQVSHLK